MNRAVNKIKLQIRDVESDSTASAERRRRATEVKERIRQIENDPIRGSATKAAINIILALTFVLLL